MKKYAAIVAAAALLASTGIASAQSRNYDSSGAPKSAPSSQRSGGLATGGMTGSGETTGKSNPAPQSGAGDRQPAPPSANIGDSNGPNTNPR